MSSVSVPKLACSEADFCGAQGWRDGFSAAVAPALNRQRDGWDPATLGRPTCVR